LNISAAISLAIDIAAIAMAIHAMRLARSAARSVAVSRASRLADSLSASNARAKALRPSNPTDEGLGSAYIRSLDSGHEENSRRHSNCSGVSGSGGETAPGGGVGTAG